MKPSILAVVIGMTVSATAIAEDHFRSHDAHVHGEVEVNIAQDGQELLVEVTAPGADVVGFEHAPQTPEQIAALEKATALLNQPSKLFAFEGADCTLEYKSVTHTLGEDDHEGHDHDKHDHHDHEGHDHDKHDHHDHEGHDHDKHDHDDHEGHDHDKHDHHDHEGHDHDHAAGGHGEFTIEYHYQCSNVAKLDTVETQWFSNFANTESITVNLLTDRAQTQQKLTPSNTSFRF
ncbi:zinc uptake protein ZrgA [Vibrio fortis]|uniref:zinc uptake protein ZrgA n=1 Tax=Vibrio fortis TaxID=212667 RepID=UPI0040689AFD